MAAKKRRRIWQNASKNPNPPKKKKGPNRPFKDVETGGVKPPKKIDPDDPELLVARADELLKAALAPKTKGADGKLRRPPRPFTPERREHFLKELAATGRFYKACDRVGVSYKTADRWRKNDKSFNRGCERALDLHVESIDEEIRLRAMVGVEKPLHYKGELTGDTITEKSDNLLVVYAKAHSPKYRDKANIEVNVDKKVLVLNTAPVTNPEDEPSLAEWASGVNKDHQRKITVDDDNGDTDGTTVVEEPEGSLDDFQ